MRRAAAGAITLGLVVAAAGGGWLAGRQIESPDEVAAKAAPPAPSRLTVPVEKRVLSSTLIVRGLVRYGEPKSVVLPQSTVKQGVNPVVSEPPQKGATATEGTKALEVGGRPVFVLKGGLPAYRDLRPGDSGVDVRQLEDALSRLGHSPGPVDGSYDSSTERAVEAWYRAEGYEAFGPTDAQRTQLANARDAAAKSSDAVLQAQKTLDQAGKPPTADKRLQADEQVRTAAEKVTLATDENTRSLARAQADVDARTAAVAAADAALRSAEDAFAKAVRDSDDLSPIGQAQDALTETQLAATEARTAAEAARQAVADAEAAVEPARQAVPEAQRAVTEAARGLDDARFELGEAQRGVVDAQKALEDAKATRVFTETAQASGTAGPNIDAALEQIRQQTVSAEAAIRTAQARVRSAEAAVRQAETGVRTAETGVRTAEAGVEQRLRSVDDAKRALTRAENAIVRADLAAKQAEASVGKAELGVIDRQPQLKDLQAKVDQARSDADRARREAELASGSLATAKRTGAETLRATRSQLRIAQAQRDELNKPADVALAREQLNSSRTSKERADGDLARLEREIGIVVPANEILFFPSLPLRIDDTKLARGDLVNGPVMTVTTNRLAVDSSLDTADASLVKVGGKAIVEASDFDITLDAEISEIASTPGTKGVDAAKVYMEIVPDNTPDSEATTQRLNGTSVKITLPISSSGGEVLAVPVAALSVAADGSSRVEVEDSPEEPTRFVTVTPGLAAEGMVAITPEGGTLNPGDQVVVGKRPAPLTDDTSPA